MYRPRILLTSLLLAGAALALVACGASDDLGVDPAAARASEVAALADLEACSLLTEEEAAEFLGVPVTYVEPFKIRTFHACEWLNDEGPLARQVDRRFGLECRSITNVLEH